MNGHAKQRRMRNVVQSNDNVIDLLPDVTVRNGDGVLHGGDNDLDTDPLMSPDELLKIDNDVICNSGGSDDTVYRTYKRRWYVLFLYTMLNLILGVLNNTWSGCEISAMVAFGWSKRNMAVLVNWAPIMNFFTTFACCWLFTKKGLRVGMVVSCALLTIGTGLRCITSSTPYVTWSVQIGQALIGLGTPVIFASPTYLSATWFPLEERLTATALSQMGIFIGATLPNIIIPFTIDEPSSQNVTNASAIFRHEAKIIGNQILDTMYVQFGVTAFLSLLVVVYFPAKPPTPVREPSLDDSFNFFGELKKLFCCRIIWCFAVSYGLLYGTYWSWQNSNDIIFVDLNYTQYEFNTVSIWSSVAFLFSQFGFAFAMPLIGTRMKTVIIGFYAGSAFFVFWLILSLLKVFPHSIVLNLGLPSTLLAVCMMSAVTLIFELANEIAYPICEGVTTGLLVWATSPFQAFLVVIQMIPHTGTEWFTWTLFASYLVSIVLLLICRVRYNRRMAEINNTTSRESS